MPVKLLFTIIGFNSLFLIFLAAIVIVYLRPQRWDGMLALFLGWLTGFINIESSEVQFPLLLLLSFGFFVGYARSKSAWRNAFILALFVPLSQFAWIIATHKYEAVISEGVGSLMAFVPAFAGAYVGKSVAHSHEMKQRSATISA